MHKLTLILLFLFGLTLPTAVDGISAPVDTQPVQTLDVVIASESPEDAEVIENMIKARLKTRRGEIFSQTAFDNDLKMLAQDYDRVEPELKLYDGNIHITLTIWTKPKIRSIQWEGNRKISTSRLKSELGTAQGALFDRQGFNKSFNEVKSYYVKQGFFEAELDYDIIYDECENAVEIFISVEEGRAGKIQKIHFSNFTKCEETEILELMVTKPYNFFLSWLTGEGTYNEDMIQHDKYVILNYLQNQGYADARIDLQVCEAKQNHRIIIHINLERGARYFFGDILVEGNNIFTNEQVKKCLTMCPGAPFSPEQIQLSIQRLTTLYGSLGYIESLINYEPKLKADANVYDVDIIIDEGEQFHVGMIKVMGNCSTKTKVILHETLLIPGEVFNLAKLKITEARLCNIGYFENVNVYAVKSEETSLLPGNYRDVHIEVEEANTGHLGGFFGFSTVENMFGGINLTERNFNAEGLKRFWSDGFSALRGGGEYFHINLSIGTKTNSYGLSWTKPYFNDTPWSVGFDIERGLNKYIADDYEVTSYGITLHATYNCNSYMRVGTHYRLKYSDTHITHHKDREDLKELGENDGLISALGLSWLYDSTDHPLKPTCGFKSRVDGEVAGLGGDWDFLSFGYLNSYYYNLWGCGILKLRGDFRFIQPFGSTFASELPVDERLFLGGDYSVRGYRSYRLGPKIDGDDEDPAGGISMQLFSVEFIKPLFSCADLFVFADSGALSKRKWNFGRFYHSVGYGARVKLFEGTPPVCLGMGYPLNAKSSSDVKKFFISIGGKF